MFYRTQIKDHIRVPPDLFGSKVDEAVLDDEKMELLEDVETEDDVFAKEETVKNGWDDD